MPNIKSAKKRMQLSEKWKEANRKRRATLRTAIKRVRQSENAEEGQTRLEHATSLLDRAAHKGILHKNKAARIKSQLAQVVAEL